MASNAETGKKIFEATYAANMGWMSGATAQLKGAPGVAASVTFTGISLTKDLAMGNYDNTNKKIGAIVGDIIDTISLAKIAKLFNNPIAQSVAVGTGATANSYFEVFSFKTIAVPFYDEYVPYADAFYTKLFTDDNFFKETLEGLKNNAWDNLKDMFTDKDGDVTASSLVKGIKELFGSPSNYEKDNKILELEYVNDNHVKIDYPSLSLDAKASIAQELSTRNEITKLTLNSQTYNITQENNISLRDNIDNISSASFLLSNILIKKGEALDIGEDNLYIIKQGDVFSKIAQSHNLTTKELLKSNTWLIDEGRVTFNQNRILIETNDINKSNNITNQPKLSLEDLTKEYFNTKAILSEEQSINTIKDKTLER
jgi:LysM repeat protein